jgi:DNA-binding response OmpR family regulator
MVDFQTGVVKLDGANIKIPRKEVDLLIVLLRNAGELVTREALLLKVWGYNHGIRTRTLDVHIGRLRHSLTPYGKLYIETVFGIGYRFQPCPRKRNEPATVAAGALETRSGSGAWRWNDSLQ